MRLLYLSADPGVPVFGSKGASVHLRAIASALHGLGHEVVIASPRVEPDLNRLPAGVRCCEIPAVRPDKCATAAALLEQAEIQARVLREIASREACEAIYERYSLATFAGARTALALGVPLVLEVNAPLRLEAKLFRRLWHEPFALSAEREVFAAARTIFAVSAALAGWLATVGVDTERVEVMGNAPPDRAFAARPPIPDGSDLIVGFAGGLKPWHGIETLVKGVELAVRAGARMRLEILGEGPADVVLDRTSLPADRLIRYGYLPQEKALAVLAKWDVGVAPFDPVPGFYFSPLKLFEYMAAGLCPVVSAVGELAEIVEQGRAGVVFPPGDPEALAQELLALDRDREKVRALGARAQALSRMRPTWSDSAGRVVRAIEDPATVLGMLAAGETA